MDFNNDSAVSPPDQTLVSRTNMTIYNYRVNFNNLAVAGFASLLTLLLLIFFLGLMYICAKLRRQSSRNSEIDEPGWVHNSFQRQSISAAAATAAMYRQGGALSWESSIDEERRHMDLANAVLEMDRRPAFYLAQQAGAGTIASSRPIPVAQAALECHTQQARSQRPNTALGQSKASGSLVRAALPNLQQTVPTTATADKPADDLAYDQLQLRDRLILSGPFENENAASCDSLADNNIAQHHRDAEEYQSDEYLDVHLKQVR